MRGLSSAVAMKRKTKFNWRCTHCDQRNINQWHGEFMIPNRYELPAKCQKCGNDNTVIVNIEVAWKPRKPVH